MHYCDAQVDKAIVSNANVFATFSTFGANAYHTAAGAATPSTAIKTCFVVQTQLTLVTQLKQFLQQLHNNSIKGE